MEFKSLAEATEAFEKLQSEFDTHKAESEQLIEAADSAVSKSDTERAELKQECESLTAKVEASESEVYELKSKLEETESKLDSEWKKAASIAAQSATDPADANADDGAGENVKSREEFEALSLADRVQFFKDGGKLS